MTKEFDMSKPPEVFYEKAPSEEFYCAVESFYCRGSSWGYCDKCGRSFINLDRDWDFEEGEEEEFEENANKYPGWFIYCDYSIPICDGLFGVGSAVVNCPCNWMKPYEDLFWRWRELIANYFENRAKEQVKDAARGKEIADGLSSQVHVGPGLSLQHPA